MTQTAQAIDKAFREGLPPSAALLETFLTELNQGLCRVASCEKGTWVTHTWVKKAILLYFKHMPARLMPDGSYDKVPLKTTLWQAADFEKAGFRMTPGAVVRKGSYIAKGAILMPCFVNVGAWVGAGTMVDSGVCVGSCAQVGENCHLSAGVTLGGVLEPPSAAPVIVEDNCFIGAGSQVVEGMHIGQGSVIAMGTTLGSSTKIIHRETNETWHGTIPPYSVVVPGTYRSTDALSLPCAVIIKTVDEATRSKTALNDLLRAP